MMAMRETAQQAIERRAVQDRLCLDLLERALVSAVKLCGYCGEREAAGHDGLSAICEECRARS
jgi:NADH pyrophosphatase NudC (nudix superfamily)